LWSTGIASDYINGHQSRMAGEANKLRILNGGTNKKINENIFEGIKDKPIRDLLYFKFDSRCYLCKCDDQILHMHHIIPQSEGGSDEIVNLVLLCPSCHVLIHSEIPLNDDQMYKKRLMRYSSNVKVDQLQGKLDQVLITL